MRTNHWYFVKKQNLAVYARAAGFDLAMYNNYRVQARTELKSRAIRAALKAIEDDCKQQGLPVSEIQRGVYVIGLSSPLSVQYRKKRSQIIYIGIGNILHRIESHFKHRLFDFMLSLSGADFDFGFAVPRRQRAPKYYKHVEYEMLEYFSQQTGGVDETRRFPLLNVNCGADQKLCAEEHWWKKPLKAAGRRPQWEMRPTKFTEIETLNDAR